MPIQQKDVLTGTADDQSTYDRLKDAEHEFQLRGDNYEMQRELGGYNESPPREALPQYEFTAAEEKAMRDARRAQNVPLPRPAPQRPIEMRGRGLTEFDVDPTDRYQGTSRVDVSPSWRDQPSNQEVLTNPADATAIRRAPQPQVTMPPVTGAPPDYAPLKKEFDEYNYFKPQNRSEIDAPVQTASAAPFPQPQDWSRSATSGPPPPRQQGRQELLSRNDERGTFVPGEWT